MRRLTLTFTMNERGATFVEVLVAGGIGVVVAGAIFYFVSFAGQGTQQIQTLQQLEQGSSLITELFMRTVRNGTYVCAGTQSTAPASDTDNLAEITVRNKDSPSWQPSALQMTALP